MIGGLASLWLPERAADPAYRAYAVYLALRDRAPAGSTPRPSRPTCSSTSQNLIEERNLFFLSPLLLLGTAMVLQARKVNWCLVAAATALVLAVAWSARLEGLGAPYYEAPGLAISTLLNRAFVFTVADVHAVLVAAAAVTIALVALRRRRWAAPARRGRSRAPGCSPARSTRRRRTTIAATSYAANLRGAAQLGRCLRPTVRRRPSSECSSQLAGPGLADRVLEPLDRPRLRARRQRARRPGRSPRPTSSRPTARSPTTPATATRSPAPGSSCDAPVVARPTARSRSTAPRRRGGCATSS